MAWTRIAGFNKIHSASKMCAYSSLHPHFARYGFNEYFLLRIEYFSISGKNLVRTSN